MLAAKPYSKQPVPSIAGRPPVIWLPQRKSLRVKLVLASLVVEVLLLTLLVVNSMRLVEKISSSRPGCACKN